VEVLEVIGSGAFGDVALARYKFTDVVVKRLRTDAGEVRRASGDCRVRVVGPEPSAAQIQNKSPMELRRAFFDEVLINAKVAQGHPNIVRVLGTCDQAGVLYAVMEKAAGRCAIGSRRA
jgi:serine/threonine protein kinase